mgnify:FL=1
MSGLRIERKFSNPDVHPLQEVETNLRTAVIKDDEGKVIFTQDGVVAPVAFSDLAVNVVASKYFFGKPGTPQREGSILGLVNRVSTTIADWGLEDGYFADADSADAFEAELSYLLINQYAAFNSPVWFNVGLHHSYGIKGSAGNWRWDCEKGEAVPCEDTYQYPQGSACFIQSVDDTMQGIMDLAKSEAMLFKYGSGTGTDLSPLRSTKEFLNGGGKPSGPVSFMRVYDSIAGVIKSGGKTRRAAKMQTLKCVHPDIMDFIECKVKEDKKARALIAQGYDSSFNGEAYGSVLFQNANLSVRATDEFLIAAESGGKYPLIAVTTGDVVEEIDAGHVLDKIAEGTWHCGDPGMQFEDTIQRWHTTADTSQINSSNPCSEFMYIDDSACNLSSLNLMKFRNNDGDFSVDRFRHACSIMILAQEIIVDRASYPTKAIAENSHRHRPLGLGYANLGALLMSYGLPYDSELGRSLAGAITAIMHGQANLTSHSIAKVKGPFEAYEANRGSFARVMAMHSNAGGKSRAAFIEDWGDIPDAPIKHLIDDLWFNAVKILSDVAVTANDADSVGYRNSQVTLLAPTGTIAFMMDCDTTGIEPDIALVKYKTLAGGGVLKIVNRTVPMALWTLGYKEDEIKWIIDWIDKTDTIEGCVDLNFKHLPVFDCAFPPPQGGRTIPWEAHVRMMAAVQPFLSGAISKTVNVPSTATVDDIRDAYLLSWKLGLKAVAIYRDGSKASQPLNTKKGADKAEAIIGDDPSLTIWDAVVKEITAWNKDELEMLTDHLTSLGLIPKGVHQVTISPSEPKRRRLPDTRASINHKFTVGGCEGYLSVGCFPDGTPGELFVTMAKEGSTLGGTMDSWATAISLCLQYGVPLDVLVAKFSSVRFEPAGFTSNPDVGMASSIVDYIVRWLGKTFIDRKQKPAILKDGDEVFGPNDPIMHMSLEEAVDSMMVATAKQATQRSAEAAAFAPSHHAPACPNCGNLMIPSGRCHACPNCGTSNGCS